MNVPRVVIAGCGRMGAERTRQASAAGAAITAFVDSDISRAQTLAAEYPDSTVHESFRTLQWLAADALFVCTPPSNHGEAIREALDHGVAVFVEKPLALDLDEAQSLAASLDAASLLNAVGYMNRHRAGMLYARSLLLQCNVIGVHCTWAAKRYGVPWWSDATRSGGPFNEQGTHVVDLLRYLAGDIDNVCAFNREQAAVGAVCEFASGAIGTLLYTCEAPEKDIALHVLTRQGSLHFRSWDFHLTSNTIDGRLFVEPENPFKAEVSGFLKAVRTGDTSGILSDAQDAARTQRIVDIIRHCRTVPT